MIERSQFELIRERHGGYASWAVWATADGSPKSNIGDLSVLDPESNPSLLSTIHHDAVMVGLNISRPLREPFRNFHDPRPQAQDFKIRYAFEHTRWWGAYMTDVIKGVEAVKSADLRRLLTTELIQRNVDAFLEELRDIGSRKPVLLAFGAQAHQIVASHVPARSYRRLVRLTHYSHYVGKEKYRDTVLSQLDKAGVVKR